MLSIKLIGFYFKHPSTKLAHNRDACAGASFLKPYGMYCLLALGANSFFYLRILGNFDKRNHDSTPFRVEPMRLKQAKISLCLHYITHFTQNNPIKIRFLYFFLAFL
jgi:hypothetical protein